MKNRLKNINKVQIIILLSAFIIVLLSASYAIYQGVMNVNVNTTSGKLSYDVVLDQNDNYIENNEPYFFIIVKNYDKDGLTNAAFDYKISVVSAEGVSALYRYIDDDGNTNTTPTSSLALAGSLDNNKKKDFKYKVYVSSDTNLKTKVNYKIDYEIVQKNMG